MTGKIIAEFTDNDGKELRITNEQALVADLPKLIAAGLKKVCILKVKDDRADKTPTVFGKARSASAMIKNASSFIEKLNTEYYRKAFKNTGDLNENWVFLVANPGTAFDQSVLKNLYGPRCNAPGQHFRVFLVFDSPNAPEEKENKGEHSLHKDLKKYSDWALLFKKFGLDVYTEKPSKVTALETTGKADRFAALAAKKPASASEPVPVSPPASPDKPKVVERVENKDEENKGEKKGQSEGATAAAVNANVAPLAPLSPSPLPDLVLTGSENPFKPLPQDPASPNAAPAFSVSLGGLGREGSLLNIGASAGVKFHAFTSEPVNPVSAGEESGAGEGKPAVVLASAPSAVAPVGENKNEAPTPPEPANPLSEEKLGFVRASFVNIGIKDVPDVLPEVKNQQQKRASGDWSTQTMERDGQRFQRKVRLHPDWQDDASRSEDRVESAYRNRLAKLKPYSSVVEQKDAESGAGERKPAVVSTPAPAVVVPAEQKGKGPESEPVKENPPVTSTPAPAVAAKVEENKNEDKAPAFPAELPEVRDQHLRRRSFDLGRRRMDVRTPTQPTSYDDDARGALLISRDEASSRAQLKAFQTLAAGASSLPPVGASEAPVLAARMFVDPKRTPQQAVAPLPANGSAHKTIVKDEKSGSAPIAVIVDKKQLELLREKAKAATQDDEEFDPFTFGANSYARKHLRTGVWDAERLAQTEEQLTVKASKARVKGRDRAGSFDSSNTNVSSFTLPKERSGSVDLTLDPKKLEPLFKTPRRPKLIKRQGSSWWKRKRKSADGTLKRKANPTEIGFFQKLYNHLVEWAYDIFDRTPFTIHRKQTFISIGLTALLYFLFFTAYGQQLLIPFAFHFLNIVINPHAAWLASLLSAAANGIWLLVLILSPFVINILGKAFQAFGKWFMEWFVAGLILVLPYYLLILPGKFLMGVCNKLYHATCEYSWLKGQKVSFLRGFIISIVDTIFFHLFVACIVSPFIGLVGVLARLAGNAVALFAAIAYGLGRLSVRLGKWFDGSDWVEAEAQERWNQHKSKASPWDIDPPLVSWQVEATHLIEKLKATVVYPVTGYTQLNGNYVEGWIDGAISDITSVCDKITSALLFIYHWGRETTPTPAPVRRPIESNYHVVKSAPILGGFDPTGLHFAETGVPVLPLRTAEPKLDPASEGLGLGAVAAVAAPVAKAAS